ncbi:MAG TPA: hypothetical protein VE978_25485 [Chitinophagales bacterium]|nr:hypothetical protein [Chitinophagales bacterium]
MDTLLGLIILIFILTLLGGLTWYIKAWHGEKEWVRRLSSSAASFVLLISWTLLGFFSKLDYTLQQGCVIHSEAIFSWQNMLYTSIALGLLSIGYFISPQNIAIAILSSELLLWLYKLFAVKGGYAVGLGGVTSLDVLVFDTIALTLRLILIKQVGQIHISTRFVFTMIFMIMFLKVQFFRL